MVNEEKDIGKVISLFDEEVLIEVQRQGSCESCALNMLCVGSSDKIQFRLKKPSFPLAIDDLVEIGISPAGRIISSFIVFILPIIVMIVFYLIARHLLHLSENIAIFSSLFGLLLSGIIIKFIDKSAADKIEVKIVKKIDS